MSMINYIPVGLTKYQYRIKFETKNIWIEPFILSKLAEDNDGCINIWGHTSWRRPSGFQISIYLISAAMEEGGENFLAITIEMPPGAY